MNYEFFVIFWGIALLGVNLELCSVFFGEFYPKDRTIWPFFTPILALFFVLSVITNTIGTVETGIGLLVAVAYTSIRLYRIKKAKQKGGGSEESLDDGSMTNAKEVST